jgi:sugar/nucleoside kinase (ribokinase family)|uniref:Carbohydrate kinase family protein n=1 Tax=Desulfobacca acetoxidans TaxID=60893 RepID=A0A7V6A249_9BACT
MPRAVICLGSIYLHVFYEVDDLEGFLSAWGTGLSRGGREVLSPEQEKRLTELLPRFARLAGRAVGGQAANAAHALGLLAVPVILAGRVGADEDGTFLKKRLTGVNLEHLVSRGESGRTYILATPGGERTLLMAPNANEQLQEEDVPPEVMASSAFVHVTSCGGKGPLAAQRHILQHLSGRLRVCFDPGEHYASLGREALTDLFDQTETLLVTEKEWELFGGNLRRLAEWAPPVVLVKRGVQGTRMLTPVRYLDFPPYAAENLLDTGGSGDVFAAGYLAGLYRGLNLPQAIRLASSLAAYALGGTGWERYPDRKVMEAVIASLR